MALPSFLKRKIPAANASDDALIVQRARTSARRRLIGAAVLLAIGVIAFPLLFETQPRPIPVDIPIEIPRKEGQAPLIAPPKSARVSGGSVADPAAGAVAEAAPVASAASLAAAASAAAPAQPSPAAAAVPGPSARPAAASSARALPAAGSAAAAAPAARDSAGEAAAQAAPAAPKAAATPASGDSGDAARFVVQVGAFAEATAAREVRLKVEKLGLKTYTQVVETPQGRRIRVRVGPFASHAEADKTLTRLKAAKLPGAVLTL